MEGSTVNEYHDLFRKYSYRGLCESAARILCESGKIKIVKCKIAIVGAGPAGSSLAIRLAQKNFDITLIERERFPRQKLCGEFISPECFAHFESLGVLETMMSAGGDRIYETSFYSPNGRSVTIPTKWLAGQCALTLSRAEMDLRLIRRARSAGVMVVENATVFEVLRKDERIAGVRARMADGSAFAIEADITIDATGRSAVVSRLMSKSGGRLAYAPAGKPAFVGFKAHMHNVKLESGRCEIYLFKGGYAGLCNIESGLANFCFLISADVVRQFKSDIPKILEHTVFQNVRAAAALECAETAGEWLAVSIESFGRGHTSSASGLFTIGDSAAFIDPFTGSGMLMAFESAELLANAITRHTTSFSAAAEEYSSGYARRFGSRLTTASLLRRAAFIPVLSTCAITAAAASARVAETLTRLTRHSVEPAFKKRKIG